MKNDFAFVQVTGIYFPFPRTRGARTISRGHATETRDRSITIVPCDFYSFSNVFIRHFLRYSARFESIDTKRRDFDGLVIPLLSLVIDRLT